MISGLRGRVHRTLRDAILLDVGGVIYHVNSSSQSILEVGETATEVYLHTHLVVREDAMLLFGFTNESELVWFETLITVNGVGPRLALAVLSKLAPEQLVTAIAHEDLSLLSTVTGVGKRTASRILLDLRGKIPEDLDGPRVAAITVEDTETILALRALGYTASESQIAVARLNLSDTASPEDRVIAALRVVGGSG
ncbi:MAG: Holliday junction branch migration protein RuvA [Thermomicrobiales bacterium]